MSKIGNLEIAGASGTKYPFEVYPLNSAWNEVAAVYTVTKRTAKHDGGGTHAYVYVGQTDNLRERFDEHHKADCFSRHAANCLCVHQESSELRRLDIEKDLLGGQAWPCNN